ncbi:MAG: hypothetical protein K8R21_06305, partial [Leptospira sp.]|nr:hypothetical protein [Leptospira sp.]
RVIFVNHPSSGELLKLEKRLTPRKLFWDRLIAETGATGIHFEDYSGLSNFDCPEWSHLSAGDSIIYTERLMDILKKRGLL